MLLSADDVHDIREHTFLDPDIFIAVIVQNNGLLRFDWSLADIEDIQGYVAASANHCIDRKLEKRLDRICSNLQFLMDSFDDQGK